MAQGTEHFRNGAPLPDRKVAAGDVIEGVQICPVGDWPNGGRPQHCTEEALRNVAAAYAADGSPEILVDFEHRAEQGGASDTTAAAWASNLRFEAGRGLVADFRVTDAGADALSNRRLRYLSVAWYVDRETREPTRVASVALTNKPNIPVAPVLNRDGGETKGNLHMERLKEILGLAPDAADEEVEAAVKALKERADAAEAAAAEAKAEEFAEANKSKADKAVLKAQFLANRKVAEAIVAAIPDPPPAPAAQPQKLLNRSAAKAPETADLAKELNRLPAGKARADYVMAHAAELAAAATAG